MNLTLLIVNPLTPISDQDNFLSQDQYNIKQTCDNNHEIYQQPDY